MTRGQEEKRAEEGQSSGDDEGGDGSFRNAQLMFVWVPVQRDGNGGDHKNWKKTWQRHKQEKSVSQSVSNKTTPTTKQTHRGTVT